jgi:hypothetical protein
LSRPEEEKGRGKRRTQRKKEIGGDRKKGKGFYSLLSQSKPPRVS